MAAGHNRTTGFGAIALILSLAGCTSFQELRSPEARVASAWHATLPHTGRTADLIGWWSTFKDRSLTTLIDLAESENPSLELSAANIAKARASLESARSSLFPVVDGSAAVTRSGTGGDKANRIAASTTASGGLDASWEFDLFGKYKRTSEAARLRVHEEVANWHDARVSLAAEVADYYVQYRGCRQLESVYQSELASQRETVRAMESAVASGLTSTADLALARAGAAESSSSLTAQRAECELLIKSLTQIAGGDETRIRQIIARTKTAVPAPASLRIASVPAESLRQRPDVAALELEVVASISDVGAAKADLYPSLGLGGSITLNSSSLSGTSLPWSFGPALSIPFFDGGQRRAAVKSAIASYDAAVAQYKSGVLSAVAEVESALVSIDSTRRQIKDASSAANNYLLYFNSINANWKAGGASLLDREEARRKALSAKVILIGIQIDSVRYWIALYKSLGGGWQGPDAPTGPASDMIEGSFL